MALYSNGFPATYQQYYPAQYQNSAQNIQQPQHASGIIWVQGEAGAKSYLVAPNTTVQLWDSEAQVIYLKSSDASGMPSMKIIDYTIRNAETANSAIPAEHDKFIRRDEFDGLKSQLDALRSELDALRKESKKDE